nr:late meristem identity 1 [Delphinium anthriscifolium var. calleryi]
MAWSANPGSNFKPFEQILNNIYENDYFNPFQGYNAVEALGSGSSSESRNKSKKEYCEHENPERKKRLTNEQLDALERSFQEEIKLEPERKMKLAQELGLQPRQIAVWFQNRRARWKVKQVERHYDTLKKEFDLVIRENHKLQEEIMALKAKLEGRASTKQGSEASAEESVESKSAVFLNSNKLQAAANYHQIPAECNYMLMDGYTPASGHPNMSVLSNYPRTLY